MEKHELRDFFFSKTLLEKIVSNSELFKGEEHWNLICLFNSVRDYIFKLFWHYHRSSRTVDVRSSGIATLLRYLRDSESEVVAVNFNYDLLVEPTPAYKGLSILKPHGSINFLPSTYDPNRDNIVSSDPTYPFSSDPTVLEKNPLYFRNYADFGDGEEIGKIALEEFGLHEIELLPPGCSGLITQIVDPKKQDIGKYLIPWAFYAHRESILRLGAVSVLVVVGLSFSAEDEEEISQYLRAYLNGITDGLVFWSVFDESQRDVVVEKLTRNSLSPERSTFFIGRFSDSVDQIISAIKMNRKPA